MRLRRPPIFRLILLALRFCSLRNTILCLSPRNRQN